MPLVKFTGITDISFLCTHCSFPPHSDTSKAIPSREELPLTPLLGQGSLPSQTMVVFSIRNGQSDELVIFLGLLNKKIEREVLHFSSRSLSWKKSQALPEAICVHLLPNRTHTHTHYGRGHLKKNRMKLA